MAKAQNKTVATDANVAAFIAAVPDAQRRADSEALVDLMSRATGCPPKMWGPGIVGFDSYHYVYDSGREGDMAMVGFSPRKQHLVLYIVPGFKDYEALLKRLGKHKTGKACLYLNKLADADSAVLEQLVAASVAAMRSKYRG